MKKMLGFLEVFSFVAAIVFCAGMDSENIIIPAVGAFTSFTVLGIADLIRGKMGD